MVVAAVDTCCFCFGHFMLMLIRPAAVACGKEDKEKDYTVRECKGKMMMQNKTIKQTQPPK